MFSFEKKLVDFLQRYILWLFLAVGLGLSLALRAVLMPVHSADINMFLIPWYEEIIQNGGLAALANHSANYNIAYLFLLFLATKLPLEPVNAIKLFSILGDYLLCFACALVVYRRMQDTLAEKGEDKVRPAGLKDPLTAATAVFVLVALLPLGIYNSGYWGQCDSIYTAFIVFSLYAVLRKHYIWSFAWFGVALCFKLQAVFFLPAFLILWAANKAFTALLFLIPPGALVLSSLPAVLFGGSAFRPFEIYKGQVSGNEFVYVNYYNLSTFFRWHPFDPMGKWLILFCLLALAALFCTVLYKKVTFTGDRLVLLFAVSAMVCVLCLPGMHERYGYAAEILLCVWFLCAPSVRRAVPTVVFYLIGFMASSRFLFGTWADGSPYLGLLNLMCTLWLCRELVKGEPEKPFTPKAPSFPPAWRV